MIGGFTCTGLMLAALNCESKRARGFTTLLPAVLPRSAIRSLTTFLAAPALGPTAPVLLDGLVFFPAILVGASIQAGAPIRE
jgi:hypothetical protein